MTDNTPNCNYTDGAHMWRDTVSSHGIDEAVVLCSNYLQLNIRRGITDSEKSFTRELFAAMYKATAGTVYPFKLFYPYDLKTACERREESAFYKNNELNNTCTRSIDSMINESYYESNYYNLDIAAMKAIQDYGFARVCAVLAYNYQRYDGDERLSSANRTWTSEFITHDDALNSAYLQSHPVLIDGFCKHVRELYQSLDAGRYTLPGSEEHGEINRGYEIKQGIVTSDDGNGFITGYVIGHNPAANSPWVCWQYAVRDGKRHYNWGIYCTQEQTARDAYNARVFIYYN